MLHVRHVSNRHTDISRKCLRKNCEKTLYFKG
jgi:hypothetical protein